MENRTLEFRVWDIKKKQMIFFNAYERFGFIDHNKSDVTSCQGAHQLLLSTDPAHYIWMQYTGLKDKNGNKIWEGDRIEWNFRNGKPEVEYVMNTTSWSGRIDENNAPFISAWGSTCGNYFRTFMGDFDPTIYAEVIGSIHDHGKEGNNVHV